MAYSHEAQGLHARGPRHTREVTCRVCGLSWEVIGHEEYGLWLPERDDDLVCEDCWGEAR